MAISQARVKELLSHQPSMVQKVFEAVPISEVWSSTQILAALQRTTRTTMEIQMLQGCLNKLVGIGLVNEPKTRHFQRAPVRETKTEMTIEHKSVDPTPIDAVEMLTELATRARGLAEDIDAAAEVIGEQRTTNEEAAKKLAQLQSIFKSL